MKKSKFTILVSIFVLAVVLRFYKIDVNPPGLYWDEAVFGYDAYSVLQTGKDHHGHSFPLFFESFGDWKLPGYHYLLIPSINILGLNELAVRFPSAFLGTLTVVVFFFLVKKITANFNLAIFTAFFLAISPWHIQFSRGGFESTAGLFFVMSGVLFFILALEKKKIYFWLLSFVLLVFSMYTYHAYRLFTPLLFLILLFLYRKQIKLNKLVIPSIISAVIFLPLIIFTFSSQGKTRAVSQSAFNDKDAEIIRVDYDQKSKRPLRFLSKYIFERPIYYSYIASKGYLDHFSPIFLFLRGDQTGRHSQVDLGQIYAFEAILILFGVLTIKKINLQAMKLFIAWIIIAPIPAAIVTPTPHAYRTLQMAPALAFFSGLGAYYVFFEKRYILLKLAIALIIIYSFLTYLHLLFIHYPKKFSADWQDGYREMVHQIQQFQNKYDKVYVTNINQVPYIYLLFYQKYDPKKFISEKGTRESFDKYYFVNNETNIYDKGRILYLAPSWQRVDGKWLSAVNDSAGRHIYSLWEVNGQN